MEKRSQWASNLGFVLAAAGSAVGLGNLWKFPYIMGKNGGFRFLIMYLLFILLLGVPVMVAEMALGRKMLKNPVGAYVAANPKAGIIGKFGLLCAFLIMSYYSVIGGWIIKYIASYVTTFNAPADFGTFIAQPVEPVVWHFVFMACAAAICYMGTKGIEQASKFMMPALFLLLFIILLRSVTLPNAGEGIRFIFMPGAADAGSFQEQLHAFFSAVVAALGQVFYSLSLCMGITITYGSYLNKDANIPNNSLKIAGLDTLVAIMAGLAIFPAVFSFGLEPAQGPGLIFGTLPKVFDSLAGGGFFAILFFVLVFFAALTSGIALLECLISFTMDEWHWSRKKSVLILATVIFLLGIPSSLSFGVMSGFEILNYNFFDFMGMLTDNFLMPIGGVMMCIFIGWIWGPRHLSDEIEQCGVKFRLKRAWTLCIRFITPVLVAVVTIVGAINVYQVIIG